MRIYIVASAVGLAGVMSGASAREAHGETLPSSIQAESADSGLIVTGEKLRRSLQDTPASVAVTPSRSIEEQGMISAYDVFDRTPNVAVDGNRTTFSMRGIDALHVSGGGEGALAGNYVDGGIGRASCRARG